MIELTEEKNVDYGWKIKNINTSENCLYRYSDGIGFYYDEVKTIVPLYFGLINVSDLINMESASNNKNKEILIDSNTSYIGLITW